jgi:hypothetical protein
MSSLVSAPIHPNPAMYLSPEMVLDLALGMDPPYDIAARYGLSRSEFDKLQAQEWFGRAVAQKRLEVSENGQMFSQKAAMMAEELFQQLFKAAITGNLAHPIVMDLTKQLTEIGQLKPRAAVGVSAGGPAFQINIQVNGADLDKAKTSRLDIQPVVEAVTMAIPLGDQLPPKPEGLRVPDFDLRMLTGSQTAVNAAVAPVAIPR